MTIIQLVWKTHSQSQRRLHVRYMIVHKKRLAAVDLQQKAASFKPSPFEEEIIQHS